MSTGYKAVKTDLFAIYRLEFYKKQKKWKFAEDKKKTVLPIKPETTSSTGSSNVLNQTYDVETEEPEPEESPLNEAFVESEGSDKNLSPDSPEGVSPKTPDPEIKLTEPEILDEQTLHEKWPEQQKGTNWLQGRLINNKWYNWPQMSKDCPNTQIWSQTPKDPANDWPQATKNSPGCDQSQMPKDFQDNLIWSQTPKDPVRDWPQTPQSSPGCDWSQIPKDFHNCHIWSQSPKDLASESPGTAKNYLASDWPQNCNNDPGSGLPQIRKNAPRSEIWSQTYKNNAVSDFPQIHKNTLSSEIWQTAKDPANAWSSPELAWARTVLKQGWSVTEIWSHKQIVPGHAWFEEGGDVEDRDGSAKVVMSAAEEWLLEPGWSQWLADSGERASQKEEDGSAKLEMSAAEEWLLEPGWSQWLADSGERASQDSIDEFMRGAHCAPHSSEMSLHVPADAAVCTCSSPAARALAHASNGALHACIRAHACTLRLLLQEAACRDQLTSTHYDTYDSLYEPPTRDVGLPPDFVAGSFRNHGGVELCEVGRGRGRLQRRIIGIGGGRPFRLGQ